VIDTQYVLRIETTNDRSIPRVVALTVMRGAGARCGRDNRSCIRGACSPRGAELAPLLPAMLDGDRSRAIGS
jgi:hypothetical protein